MRALFGLVLIVGLALAGAAVYMAQNYINETQKLLAAEKAFNAKAGKLVEVFVVNKELKYGDPLTEDDVQAIYWPEKFLPKTIFQDKEILFPKDADGPRYVMRSIEPFEPVLSSRVTEPGEFAGLTAKLEPGMRAFAVKVGVASGVSGFVQPDDFIDIYWTGTFSGSDGEVTRLIESSIKIIAVDNSIGEGQSTSGTVARTITVAGTPEQVARLAQAQSTGRLSMSLVGDSNEVITEKVEVDKNSMLGIEEEEVVEVEAEKVCTVKQGLGAAAVEVEIDCKE
jgi:pilus assembly protein CpaB